MSQEKIEFRPQDLKWTEYVLSLMDESEKFNGKPKYAGLRRMVELILGRVIYSRTTLVEKPTQENNFSASSEYVFKVKTHDGDTLEFGDVADCSPENCGDARFKGFCVAISSTRAKSRSYRDALCLSCVTFDELPKDANSIDAADFEPMNDAQIDTCRTICKRLKLKFEDFVFEETGLKDLNKISRLEGARLVKELNRQQQAEK